MGKVRKRTVVLGALLGAAMTAGCQGAVGGSSSRPGVSGSGGSSVSPTDGGLPPVNSKATDPGTVAIHRLNLAEYDNTMRDLLGLAAADAHPSVTFNFPPDDRGTDFDNSSSLLTLSTLHVSCYNAAATSLVPAAMANPAQRARLTACDL
ncbi:MAG TPA: DUF1587 domain-containing protein, partial [Polyangia bacterium]